MVHPVVEGVGPSPVPHLPAPRGSRRVDRGQGLVGVPRKALDESGQRGAVVSSTVQAAAWSRPAMIWPVTVAIRWPAYCVA